MLEKYKVITATHKTAPFKALGSYVIGDASDEVSCRLKNSKSFFEIEELYYLATCNRVIYILATEQEVGEQFKKDFLNHIYPELDDEVSSHFQLLHGDVCVTHLFKVASSMDSMVVGEREIFRQMRTAFDWCRDERLTGDNIRLLFRSLIETAKHIYSNTRIGEKPVSIVSLAIQELGTTDIGHNSRILLIGAGKTNALVSKFLLKKEIKDVVVFNRSLDGAEKIANRFSNEAYTLDQLDSFEKGFDCIIVCTASVEPIITPSLYASLLKGDQNQKVVIDLAVPNNVSGGVLSEYDINYISVESLKKRSEENLQFRHKEVELAEAMLIEALEEFKQRYQQRVFETAFQKIPDEIKAIKKHAIDKVFKSEMDQLDDESKEVVEKMLTYMEKKCIGIPMKVVRELSQ